MKTHLWRHDVQAEEKHLNAAQCQFRKSDWDDYCGVGDVEMAFVAISQTEVDVDAQTKETLRMQAAAPKENQVEDPQEHAPYSQLTCSPRGSARKFARSPQSGWHDLGRVDSYVNCANIAGSMGYRNLVWNNGSAAKGRCYGFSNDVPDLLQRGCEDTYCWLFGPACGFAGKDAEKGQSLIGRSLINSRKVETAYAKVKDFVEAERHATQEADHAVREAEEDEAHAIEDAEEHVREAVGHSNTTEAATSQPGGSPRTREELEAWGAAAPEARPGRRAPRGARGGAGAPGAALSLGKGAVGESA